MKFFNGLSPQGKIIFIVVLVILLIIIWRRYGYKVKNIFQTKEITTSTVTLQNGQVVTVSGIGDLPQSQRTYLEDLANKIKNDIYGLNWLGVRDTKIYEEANALSDVEIDYLATYYKRQLTSGTSLYEDMNNEYTSYFQDNTGFRNLINKLAKTGNK